MNTLQIFNYNGNEVRTVQIDGKTWLVLKDICEVFGETNYRRVSGKLDEDEKGVSQINTPGGVQNMTIINESGLYAALFAMQPTKARGVTEEYIEQRKEQLKTFRKWVTADVLPSIRKHGAYMTPETLEQAILNPDFVMGLCQQIKAEREARAVAEQERDTAKAIIEDQKPLVEFATQVSDASNVIEVGTLAKLAKDENINIGRNKLFKWLREKNILMDNNVPYQRFMDSGYFEVKERVIHTPYRSFVEPTTYVTGKGQIYLIERLKKEFGVRAS